MEKQPKIINRCEHVYLEYCNDLYRITKSVDFEDVRTENITVYRLSGNNEWYTLYNSDLSQEIINAYNEESFNQPHIRGRRS